ncbi:MAG: hypothetical protein MJ099_02675 [Clostridia bacterium]|nr:hypothetical protein [Clostridia bacterium]
MIGWIIAAVFMIACIVLIIAYVNKKPMTVEPEPDDSAVRIEKLRRENRMLRRKLEVREKTLDEAYRRLDEYEQRDADNYELMQRHVEAKRQAEIEASAMRMRAEIGAQELAQIREEAKSREALYQSILSERDEEIERLKSTRKPAAARRRKEVSEEQISIFEVMED